LTAFATDLAGNVGPTATNIIRIDTTPPSLALGASQPPVVNYASNQPVTRGGAFSCPPTGPCIDKRPFTIGAAAERITSEDLFKPTPTATRVITRWSNMLSSTVDAPELLLAVSDDSALTLAYTIAESCAEPSLTNAVQVDASTFKIVLVAENMAVTTTRLAAMKASNLCLTVKATDVANNSSATTTRHFKWTSVAPPLPVTTRQTNISTTTLTWPTGIRDLATFRNFEADDVLLGSAGTYVAAHAHVHNPYTVPVKARVSPNPPSNAIKLAANARSFEAWSTESVPRIRDIRTTSTNHPLLHPKSPFGQGETTGPRDWTFVSPSTYANERVVRVTSLVTPALGLLSTASITTEQSSRPRPTSSASLVTGDGSTLSLSPRVFTTTAAGVPLAPVSAIDVNGFFTIQPGETFVVAYESFNNLQTVNEPFNNQNAKAQIDSLATTAFLFREPGTPSLSTPPSPVSTDFAPAIYMRRVGNVDVNPRVLVWSTTTQTQPLECQASECALGKKYTILTDVQAVTRSTVPVVMATTTTDATNALSWATEDSLPTTLRTATAPTNVIILP
jgi:hypothetical protein